jgi:hypothetical protein
MRWLSSLKSRCLDLSPGGREANHHRRFPIILILGERFSLLFDIDQFLKT